MMSGELVITHRGNITECGPFRLSVTGLLIDGEPSYEQWSACGQFFQRAGGSAQWWIGDWLNYGESKYGETYSQAIEVTGLDYQTLRDIKWIADEFELSRRHDNLSFAHHREVACLPDDKADELLFRAETEGLTTKELRSLVNQAKNAQEAGVNTDEECCTVQSLETLVNRGMTFGTIYADPPWRYSNQGTRASTDNHYSTMT